jgi:nicotinamidase-related amidase
MTTKYAENYSKNYGKYFATLLLVLCLTMALNGCEEWSGKHEAPKGAGTALILIDLQWDYLQAEGARPVAQTQVEPLIKAVNQMVAAANSNAVPIIYIEDEYSPFQFISDMSRNYAAMRYERGAELDPRISGVAGIYLTKDTTDAFSNPWLSTQLESTLGASRLVIAGVSVDRGVLETARTALARGYKVTVISDAVAAESAEARQAELNELKSAGAEIMTSAEYIASLNAGAKNS